MLWVDWCFALKLKSSLMILLSKLPVDGTRNGNDAMWSACEQKQLWPNNCLPTSKRTLCGFISWSLQQENAATTLYPASTTWMRHPCVLSCPWIKHWNSSSSKASVHREIWLCHSLFVFPSIRKGGWMNRASENGFDRVCHMLSVPFWCGTHSELTWPILWKMTWSSETLTSQLSLEA